MDGNQARFHGRDFASMARPAPIGNHESRRARSDRSHREARRASIGKSMLRQHQDVHGLRRRARHPDCISSRHRSAARARSRQGKGLWTTAELSAVWNASLRSWRLRRRRQIAGAYRPAKNRSVWRELAGNRHRREDLESPSGPLQKRAPAFCSTGRPGDRGPPLAGAGAWRAIRSGFRAAIFFQNERRTRRLAA